MSNQIADFFSKTQSTRLDVIITSVISGLVGAALLFLFRSTGLAISESFKKKKPRIKEWIRGRDSEIAIWARMKFSHLEMWDVFRLLRNKKTEIP